MDKRKAIVVVIMLSVALLHFVAGSNYTGPFPAFVNGYLIDILLPFALVLLLGVSNIAAVEPPLIRGVFVFAIGVAVETLQYFGVPLFGRTFDPLDLLAYAVGVLTAMLFERLVQRDDVPSGN